MSYVLERDWREIFALAAEAKAEKRREERVRQFYEDVDQERDLKLKVKEKEEKEEKAFEEAMATTAELATFNDHLEAYDTATVHALMDNGEAMERVNEALRQMKETAFTLPDGRHVFKTSDGRQVFDEHGTAVPVETIDPHAISDRYPVWEKFRDLNAEKGRLEDERHDLQAFQSKVDAARDKGDDGKVSKKELDDLEADLKVNAPMSVRRKLGQLISDHCDEREQPTKQVSLSFQSITNSPISTSALPHI